MQFVAETHVIELICQHLLISVGPFIFGKLKLNEVQDVPGMVCWFARPVLCASSSSFMHRAESSTPELVIAV